MKRRRLYNKRGTYNKHGMKFSEDMTKAIGKLLRKYPGYDRMDMERVIIRTTAYVSTMENMREHARNSK